MVYFQRAIFLSWYCGIGDCKYCYMSLQKDKIKDPKKAKRRLSSVLAEVLICRLLNWKIEFLSGGYEVYTKDDMLDLISKVSSVYGDKLWLNIGYLSEEELNLYKPYVEGYVGAIECVNKEVHKEVCPSKPIEPFLKMFEVCDKVGLKKGMTLILGLGETKQDIPKLIDFVKEHGINRITFYSLNPHEGTGFTKGPTTEYYIKWISAIRKEFPALEIIAGSWVDRLEELPELVKAGANDVTKFPSIKLFGTKFAKNFYEIEHFDSVMKDLPSIDWDLEVDKLELDNNLKDEIKDKLKIYVTKMTKNELKENGKELLEDSK